MSDEGRRERVTTVLTPSEREAVELVAARRGTSVSSLLRDVALPRIMAEAKEAA